MSMKWHEGPFFADSCAYQGSDVSAMSGVHAAALIPGNFLHRPERPPYVTLNSIHCGGIHLQFLRQEGDLVRTADSSGRDVTYAAIIRGKVLLQSHSNQIELTEGDSLLAFPGYEYVQYSSDLSALIVRVPNLGLIDLRLRALPAKQRHSFVKKFTYREALDLFNFTHYVSTERDRVLNSGNDRSVRYIESLCRALKQTILSYTPGIELGTPKPSASHLRICLQCDQALRATPTSRFSATELADAANCSVRQLYRAFEDVVGLTPKDYQRRIRLQRARVRINQADEQTQLLSHEAKQMGFSSYSSFLHHYRQEYGESPEETRTRRAELLALTARNCLQLDSALISRPGIAKG